MWLERETAALFGAYYVDRVIVRTSDREKWDVGLARVHRQRTVTNIVIAIKKKRSHLNLKSVFSMMS